MGEVADEYRLGWRRRTGRELGDHLAVERDRLVVLLGRVVVLVCRGVSSDVLLVVFGSSEDMGGRKVHGHFRAGLGGGGFAHLLGAWKERRSVG